MTSGDLAALELDHDPDALAVGLVAQVGDALDRLLAHQLGDPLDQPRLVHLVRDLGDDDRLAVALRWVSMLGARAHLDDAAAGGVGGGSRRGRGWSRRSGSRARGSPPSASRAGPSGSSMQQHRAPSITSVRLCGGMLVAMPTAMPDEPLIRRFGTLAGSTVGSRSRAVVVGHPVDRLLVDVVAQHLLGELGRAAPRCSASPPGCRRRSSRSCPGRRPAGSACEKSCAMRTTVS